MKGHWTLVFFGFTSYLDVCPSTLAILGQAEKHWENLPETRRPQVLFVSIDPDRDSPLRLSGYARAFHKNILTTTADTPALQRFATALGLPFRKVPGKSYAENPLDDTMDHSTAIVVLDPQGRHVGMIHPPFNAEEIATDLQKLTKETTL
ncbi:cytochrome-c oxidase [Xylella fastidiosa subsp. pauca]|nr:cytochrome-c oxidase [Xylella fastidiosa subsp. pauca]TNW23542.1 SCO family protein [Xylella fastidiosa subsp. pauca]TNW27019.1 SCO family protein [Xylella fastidiosa subsp. pauca]